MTYADAVHFLYSLGNEVQSARLGLERIQRLLVELGNPHRAGRFVHVAGTNGKGSTSAMIESGLRASGFRTGLYTSPHLSEPTERIRLQGVAVSEAQFADAFVQVHEASERLLAAHEVNIHPTYFECVTAMAFLLFRDAGVEWVVLETGMGGRLDATNVVLPEVCVITPIDMDHQHHLGDTIQLIAREKAGILKAGIRAIFAHQRPEAEAVLVERSAAIDAPIIRADDWEVDQLELSARGSRFRVGGVEVHCPLAGEHQVENSKVAALVLQKLGVDVGGIAQTVWPGRLEQVSRSPEVILDGAHNPAGIEALIRYLERFYSDRNVWLVYGALRDKAVAEMTALLFPHAQRIILTMPLNSRAMAPETIEARDATITHTVADALAVARSAGPGDVVFITGSLFLVGEARALLVQ